jgi:hypothetical protein
MSLLSYTQILRLHMASVSAGLAESRTALLGGLDVAFVTTLPAALNPSAQILNDLTALNAIPELRGGTVPLRVWLETAMQLAGSRVEADVFREALSLLGAAEQHRVIAREICDRRSESNALGNTTKRFDLFLSHNSVDKPWVLRLKQALEERGLTVWLDRDEIRPGDLFVGALEQGLLESRAVALVISPESLCSGWVREEYSRVLALTHGGDERVQLIPVLLRDVELPGLLADHSWVDFRDASLVEQDLDKLIWGATGKKPNASPVKPLKRRALLDRRLAAELIISYPRQVGSRRVDVRSQYSNLYALSVFDNVFVENHFGSILSGLVSEDELLREAILFTPRKTGGDPPELSAAVSQASSAWLDDPGFLVAASMYGRSKGNLTESLPDAVAYLQQMLLLARRFDTAIVPHPDRWRLYHHWFEHCFKPPADAKQNRIALSLSEPAAAAEAVSTQRAALVAQVASRAPRPVPLAHLVRYGPMVYPLPTAYAKQQDSAFLATYPAFTYEFCTAGSIEATR